MPRLDDGFRLKPYQKKRIVELFTECEYTLGELAAMYDCHKRTIERALREGGVTPNPNLSHPRR